MSDIEIVGRVERRRKWTLEEKAALIAEVEAEGGKVKLVARRHRMSESLLYNWRSAWKAAAAASAGPSGSVQVVLCRSRQVEMNDAADAVDVDPSGCHVGGDKGLRPSGGEGPQCLLSLGLGSAPVEWDGFGPGCSQLFGHPIGTVLRATKHDGRTV